jgi:malate/lactate dehydrogenase
MQEQERKVAVISAGFVGTTYVYALMHTGPSLVSYYD